MASPSTAILGVHEVNPTPVLICSARAPMIAPTGWNVPARPPWGTLPAPSWGPAPPFQPISGPPIPAPAAAQGYMSLALSALAPDWIPPTTRWSPDGLHFLPCLGLVDGPARAQPDALSPGRMAPRRRGHSLRRGHPPSAPSLREQPAPRCCPMRRLFVSVLPRGWNIADHRSPSIRIGCLYKQGLVVSFRTSTQTEYFHLKWQKKSPRKLGLGHALIFLGYSKQLFTEMTSEMPEKCGQRDQMSTGC